MTTTPSRNKIIGYQDSKQAVGYLDIQPASPISQNTDEKSAETAYDASAKSSSEATQTTPVIEQRHKLNDLIKKQRRILYRLKTVFPVSLFPDEMTIEDDKVDIVRRGFFASEEIRSSAIADITHIEVETSLFFTTIVIGSDSFSDKSIKISGFWTKQAKKARRIIEGLRVIHAADINSTSLSTNEIVAKAEALGTAKGVEEPAASS